MELLPGCYLGMLPSDSNLGHVTNQTKKGIINTNIWEYLVQSYMTNGLEMVAGKLKVSAFSCILLFSLLYSHG